MGRDEPAPRRKARASRFPSSGRRGISSVGRALAWHARGQGFKSPILHYDPPPQDLEFFISAEVPSGGFASPDEAIVEAISLLWREQQATSIGKILTPEDVDRQLLERGLLSRLPDPAEDLDDDEEDDLPVPVEGSPSRKPSFASDAEFREVNSTCAAIAEALTVDDPSFHP